MVITWQISAQGVTRQGRNTTSDTDFVTKNGKIVDIPALSRYGEELLIRVPVNLVTASITNIASNSAISGGDISGDNGLPVLIRGICWNTYPEPTIAHFKTSDGTGTGAFTSQLSVLMPSTTYYIRAYATNISGTTYGEEISFTTLPRTDPSECLIAWYPFNGDAAEATGYGANGTVNGAILTEDRFGNPNSAFYFNGIDNSITIPGNLAITNSFTISFWAYPERESGYSNVLTDGNINYGGNDFLINFRDSDIGIRADKGSSPLNYEDRGYPGLTNLNFLKRWVHVAWVMEPGGSKVYLDGYKIAEINEAGTNEGFHDDHVTIGARHVWTNMDNFFQGKLDEFRIYNCNLNESEIYSVYSKEGSLLPTIETAFLSDTTATSISSGSKILSDGGSPITERGVCWSTSPNPTIGDNRTLDGTGTGSFTSQITGLLPGTTYYIRSYATNSAGITYGSELSFQTHSTFPNCGSVTDIDGNIYNTVTIGTQCWMKENLKTTRYNDGTPISLVNTQNNWNDLTISSKAYCWYNDDINNKDPYGALYTWAAAMNGADTSTLNPSGVQGVCPTGWHLPSWNEWGVLIKYLDPYSYIPISIESSIAGGKMKETGLSHWNSPNTGATNESGFTGLPGGGRSQSGEFLFFGNESYWWSTSQFGSVGYARVENLNYNNSSARRTSTPWKSGISVRCIKNPEQTIHLPTLGTTTVSNVIDTSAVCGGEIISNGGTDIISHGVCWSTSTNPTTANNKTIEFNGSGTFSNLIFPLIPGTTYYVRAYAINSAGTSYGNELSFSTCPAIPAISFNLGITYGKVSDVDGNEYKTVIIGVQEWMAENLRTTRYNNGDAIPNITNDETWRSLSDGAYCWLNDNICYKPTYGGIYNWYAANSNLCPVGWHLPSNAEWSILNATLGGNEIAGGKLKEQGFNHWKEPNTGATNESGFSALPPGGFRNGALFDTGEFASFWTSTEYPDNQAFYRSMSYQYALEAYSWGFKSNGANVRCVKGPIPPKPVVSTLWTRNIQSDQAEIISTISSELPINTRGVCWDTSPSPDVLDNKTTDGNGTGSFTSKLTDLEPNNTYFVRAYSMNDDGITYGNELVFTTAMALPVDGLVAYWPFNYNANDESGNNNNGSVTSAILTSDRFGNPDRAYSFDGNGDYILVPDNDILSLVSHNFSFSFWVYINPGSGTDVNMGFISKRRFDSMDAANWEYNHGYDGATGNTIRFWFSALNGRCATYSGIDNYASEKGQWIHCAATSDNVSLKIYKDGILMAEAPRSYICSQGNGTGPLVFGRGGGWNQIYYLNGMLDDIRIYNRALSISEIEALYHEGGW